MTSPDDRRKGSPRERFRNILAADQEDGPAREPRRPAVVNLPKLAEADKRSTSEAPASRLPGSPDPRMLPSSRLLRGFWTAGGILSVLANVVLLGFLMGGRGLTPSAGGDRILPAVYASLEQLDAAHIRATIPLQTSISLDTTVPVKASTRITLERDLFVRGAHVTINSSGLSIDSPADITLPAGTTMDVNLDVALPMQAALPVTAEVPFDIAIRDTELHAAIQGLKDSLRQQICSNSPGATLGDGTPICR